MALAPLASEILDFWFVPRAGEAIVSATTPHPHPNPLPHAGEGEATTRAGEGDATTRAGEGEARLAPRNPLPHAGEGAAKPRVRGTRDVWFRKDGAFDEAIRQRFGNAIAAGIAGAFGEWCTTARGSLARVVLLDQFTRNAFRGTPDAFAGDAGALATAEDAIERGFDQELEARERWFLYMPFQHSEALPVQERGVALFAALAAETGLTDFLPYPERHRDIVRRFGRFPHRNETLGRASTPEEIAFLQQPGSRF